ncbi:MAG: PIN domain-containing protein [Micromonosporaceae bacterium]|nr:PIN domain-containing protein [Micromonosporaceae bacterium]
MIVDSSAMIAILLREPGHEELEQLLTAAEFAGVGAPTLVETSAVLGSRLGPLGKSLLARFVQEAGLEVIDFAAEHWTVAADAYLQYGKGRHPAGLNFGDCLTYAVCKVSGDPLLCKGDDFPATDLPMVG